MPDRALSAMSTEIQPRTTKFKDQKKLKSITQP